MSLVEIQSPPTAENSAIHLHATDNVAVARVSLAAGTTVRVDGHEVTALAAIPAGHKMALRSIPAGDAVRRYGQVIGKAKSGIEPGSHIHVHNLAFDEGQRDYQFPVAETPYPALPANIPTFQGYLREDGRVGTRNYLAVVAASNCAAHTAELLAESFAEEALPANIDGVVAFPHGEGCGHTIGPDTDQLKRTLWGVLDHPNVAGAIVLGLGCEVNQIDHYVGGRAPRQVSNIVGTTLQNEGGTRATIEHGRKILHEMIERYGSQQRVTVPASKIVLGLNCGGSDSFSGITANPSLGWASDRLAEIHASAVLAETTECFGAEHLLVSRARNREVAERFLSFIEGYKTYLRRFGGSFDDNPSPGNKEGGLTTILEKSLGAATNASLPRDSSS
jgi:altronate hydrolase